MLVTILFREELVIDSGEVRHVVLFFSQFLLLVLEEISSHGCNHEDPQGWLHQGLEIVIESNLNVIILKYIGRENPRQEPQQEPTYDKEVDRDNSAQDGTDNFRDGRFVRSGRRR